MNNLSNLIVYSEQSALDLLKIKMNKLCIEFEFFTFELKKNNILVLLKEYTKYKNEITKIELLISDIQNLEKSKKDLEDGSKGMFSFLTKPTAEINSLEEEILSKEGDLHTVTSNFNLLIQEDTLKKLEDSALSKIQEDNSFNSGQMDIFLEKFIISKMTNISDLEDLKNNIEMYNKIIDFSLNNTKLLAKIILGNLNNLLLKNITTKESYVDFVNKIDLSDISVIEENIKSDVVEEVKEEPIKEVKHDVVEEVVTEEVKEEPMKEVAIEDTKQEPEEDKPDVVEEVVAEEVKIEPVKEVSIEDVKQEEQGIAEDLPVVSASDLFGDMLNSDIVDNEEKYDFDDIQKDALL